MDVMNVRHMCVLTNLLNIIFILYFYISCLLILLNFIVNLILQECNKSLEVECSLLRYDYTYFFKCIWNQSQKMNNYTNKV